LHGRHILVELLLANAARDLGSDGPVPGQGHSGQLERCLLQLDLALGLVQLGLVGAGIDLEQQVSLLDLRPFLERHLDQITRDAGPDIHRLHRVRSAGEVHKVGDFPLKRLADRNHWRLGRAHLRLPGSAADRQRPQGQAETKGAEQDSVAHGWPGFCKGPVYPRGVSMQFSCQGPVATAGKWSVNLRLTGRVGLVVGWVSLHSTHPTIRPVNLRLTDHLPMKLDGSRSHFLD
jgi:hypothetical protein